MTYFEKPDHEYHRVIFEFTDKEIENAGFYQVSKDPGKLEMLQLLQRIANDDKKQLDVPWTFSMTSSLDDLQRKKDGWKAKALRLIGFLNNKDKEIKWLKEMLEKIKYHAFELTKWNKSSNTVKLIYETTQQALNNQPWKK